MNPFSVVKHPQTGSSGGGGFTGSTVGGTAFWNALLEPAAPPPPLEFAEPLATQPRRRAATPPGRFASADESASSVVVVNRSLPRNYGTGNNRDDGKERHNDNDDDPVHPEDEERTTTAAAPDFPTDVGGGATTSAAVSVLTSCSTSMDVSEERQTTTTTGAAPAAGGPPPPRLDNRSSAAVSVSTEFPAAPAPPPPSPSATPTETTTTARRQQQQPFRRGDDYEEEEETDFRSNKRRVMLLATVPVADPAGTATAAAAGAPPRRNRAEDEEKRKSVAAPELERGTARKRSRRHPWYLALIDVVAMRRSGNADDDDYDEEFALRVHRMTMEICSAFSTFVALCCVSNLLVGNVVPGVMLVPGLITAGSALMDRRPYLLFLSSAVVGLYLFFISMGMAVTINGLESFQNDQLLRSLMIWCFLPLGFTFCVILSWLAVCAPVNPDDERVVVLLPYHHLNHRWAAKELRRQRSFNIYACFTMLQVVEMLFNVCTGCVGGVFFLIIALLGAGVGRYSNKEEAYVFSAVSSMLYVGVAFVACFQEISGFEMFLENRLLTQRFLFFCFLPLNLLYVVSSIYLLVRSPLDMDGGQLGNKLHDLWQRSMSSIKRRISSSDDGGNNSGGGGGGAPDLNSASIATPAPVEGAEGPIQTRTPSSSSASSFRMAAQATFSRLGLTTHSSSGNPTGGTANREGPVMVAVGR